MQKITLYATANETLASIRDSANARSASAPVFVRDVEVELHLRLFANANEQERYVLPSEIVSYGWYMDVDFDTTTAFKIVGDNADIVVAEVDDTIDPDTGEITEYGYTDIKIPITNMNSEALVDWLGTNKSMSGLIGELCGYDSTGASIFVLQVEGFTVRNRLSDTGMPSENVENYLTIDEARALFGAMESADANAFNSAVMVINSGDDDVDGLYKHYYASNFPWLTNNSSIYKNIFINEAKKSYILFDEKQWYLGKMVPSGNVYNLHTMYIYPWVPSPSNDMPPTDYWYKNYGYENTPEQTRTFVRYVPQVNVIQTSY